MNQLHSDLENSRLPRTERISNMNRLTLIMVFLFLLIQIKTWSVHGVSLTSILMTILVGFLGFVQFTVPAAVIENVVVRKRLWWIFMITAALACLTLLGMAFWEGDSVTFYGPRL